jgi:golgi SNAP receptor complex member 1
LSSFGRITNALATSTENGGESSSHASKEPISASLIIEIEENLNNLGDINEQMGRAVLGGSPGFQSVNLHTVHRHKEIWHDYSMEFRKAKSKLTHAREQAELLSNVRAQADSYRDGSRVDQLLRERGSLNNSERATEAIIMQASATREDLLSQRSHTINIGDRLTGLRTRFPQINQVMEYVGRKKQRDMLILAVVIGILIAVLLIFMWNVYL